MITQYEGAELKLYLINFYNSKHCKQLKKFTGHVKKLVCKRTEVIQTGIEKISTFSMSRSNYVELLQEKLRLNIDNNETTATQFKPEGHLITTC